MTHILQNQKVEEVFLEATLCHQGLIIEVKTPSQLETRWFKDPTEHWTARKHPVNHKGSRQSKNSCVQSTHLECLPVSLRTSRWHDGTEDLAPGVLVSAAARGENVKENKRHCLHQNTRDKARLSFVASCLRLPNSSRERAGLLAAGQLTGCGRPPSCISRGRGMFSFIEMGWAVGMWTAGGTPVCATQHPDPCCPRGNLGHSWEGPSFLPFVAFLFLSEGIPRHCGFPGLFTQYYWYNVTLKQFTVFPQPSSNLIT